MRPTPPIINDAVRLEKEEKVETILWHFFCGVTPIFYCFGSQTSSLSIIKQYGGTLLFHSGKWHWFLIILYVFFARKKFSKRWIFLHQSSYERYTIPFKINHPVHNIRTKWPNFRLPTVRKQQSILLKKTLIEVYSSHLHASFGTFCVQIGQLFETQLVFEEYLKSANHHFRRKISPISNF